MTRKGCPRARGGYVQLVGFGEPVRVRVGFWKKDGKQIDPTHLEFKCRGCRRWRAFAFGGAPDPVCDECWSRRNAIAA